MSKLPPEYKDRIQRILQNILPGIKKVVDASMEFGCENISAPLSFPGYDKEFEVIIRPRSDLEPERIKHPPTHAEVETKAKALYVSFYASMRGATKDEAVVSWDRLRRETVNSPQGSEAMAYTGWVAAAREALS